MSISKSVFPCFLAFAITASSLTPCALAVNQADVPELGKGKTNITLDVKSGGGQR